MAGVPIGCIKGMNGYWQLDEKLSCDHEKEGEKINKIIFLFFSIPC